MSIQINKMTETFSAAPQISVADLNALSQSGFKTIFNHRPDGEGGETQATSDQIQAAAQALGLAYVYLPVLPNDIRADQVAQFKQAYDAAAKPVLGFCRTGNRASKLYALAHADTMGAHQNVPLYDVVIVGGGAGGIGVAASLLKRDKHLKIAIIEPSEHHYYQPAWTLVGGGAFDIKNSVRNTADCMPKSVTWVKAAVTAFSPEKNLVHTDKAGSLSYQQLIVAAGLSLNWEAIPGLTETLGKNGVTSNYRFDLAPYTWQLVQNLKSGKAIFTQPPMPVKCAGAPQKAMYLACSEWERTGVLKHISVELNNAGAVLFGVAAFVPPLMAYIQRYNAQLCFNTTLIEVDGANKKAWFNVKDAEGNISKVEKTFDMLHVVPAQCPPEFIKKSPLANADGWVDVHQNTMQHRQYPNIFALGDVISSPNAKTVAAVRQQIVVVAENLLALRANKALPTTYYGYGGCPLTVEKGKIVLAEFGFGGTLLPTFKWINAKVPSRLFWHLKRRLLPWIYWQGMLKGHEWLARPTAPAKPTEVK